MLTFIHSVTLLILAASAWWTVLQVSRIERLVSRLAKQCENQATLINEQSQLIVRITRELRR